MLTVQEALLFQAAKDEQDRIDAQGTAGVIGGMTGVVLGTTGGMIPHNIGKQINKVRGHTPARFKAGPRMAGGLTGLILGGALGAGTAAVMKQDNPAANVLAKIQAKGELTEYDEYQLQQVLRDIYSNQSRMA